MPPPPPSQLFPYTTLFRSLAEKMGRFLAQMAEGRMQEIRLTYAGEIVRRSTATLTLALVRGLLGTILSEHVTRSEEHTSELQSLRHLVCRLLLEKKKTR